LNLLSSESCNWDDLELFVLPDSSMDDYPVSFFYETFPQLRIPKNQYNKLLIMITKFTTCLGSVKSYISLLNLCVSTQETFSSKNNLNDWTVFNILENNCLSEKFETFCSLIFDKNASNHDIIEELSVEILHEIINTFPFIWGVEEFVLSKVFDGPKMDYSSYTALIETKTNVASVSDNFKFS